MSPMIFKAKFSFAGLGPALGWVYVALFTLVFLLMLPSAMSAEPATGSDTPSIVAQGNHAHYSCPMLCQGLHFDEPGKCPVCGMDLVSDLEKGGEKKSSLMPGLGDKFTTFGILFFLIASFLGWRLGSSIRISDRRDPIRGSVAFLKSKLTSIGKSKWVPFVFQLPVVLLFLFVIATGLFGNQEPGRNIALVLTWNLWWMGLTFMAFFLGSAWCTVCPWMAIPDWALNLFGPFRRESSGTMRWPKFLRNLYPAIFMLLFVSWLELAYDAPNRPAFTAWMGIGILTLATLFLVFTERKTFCRYVCPVGRATGAYSLTGLAAIRRVDSQQCKSCESKACFKGSEQGLACPTFEFMGAMNDNMYCTMCTECLKSCPHDNIEIHLRAPFSDLFGTHRKRMDEAILILSIAAVTIFHGISMIPFWGESVLIPMAEYFKSLGLDPGYYVIYTLALLGFLSTFFVLYAGVIGLTRLISGNLVYGFRAYFVNFAYATLPLSLGYHLAHNALHLFYEGSKAFKLASDPFGWGWDLFGSAAMAPTMLVPMPVLYVIQILFLAAGYGGAIALSGQASRKLIGNRTQVLRTRIPITLFFVVLFIFCFWLLSEPMEMRTG